MIKVEDLPYAVNLPKIKVKVSNKLFKELGKNTYDFLDLISEFIDNSIAASLEKKLLQISIEIGIAKLKKDSYLLVKDNAGGIPRALLGEALSPGKMAGGTTLNEHGLGMKQAIFALGKLKYLASKTAEDEQAIIIDELKFNDITPKVLAVQWDYGTEICVNHLKKLVPRSSRDYTTKIVPYLGARYRRYLCGDNPFLEIRLELKDLQDSKKHKYWDIKARHPSYYHPIKKDNSPIIFKKKFKGKNWEAELSFGYAPETESEYRAIQVSAPKQYEPYKVSISKQGLDILKNDRVINFHHLSELGLVSSKDNKFNLIRGELDLLKGFTTAITKNYIVRDANFVDLINQIKNFTQEKKLLDKKPFAELPEDLLIERLVNHLRNKKQAAKKIVKGYLVKGLGKLDILADGEAWKVKKELANGVDVYQLFAFMDMGKITKGRLVAPEFEKSAHYACQFIKENHHKEIDLVQLLSKSPQLPITEEEMKKYF